MKLYNWNNCPPTVSRQVSAVEVLCRHYLKDSFIGMYIHGSLSAYLDEHLSQLVKQAIDYYETDNATEFNLSDELLNNYIGKVHQVLKAYIQ